MQFNLRCMVQRCFCTHGLRCMNSSSLRSTGRKQDKKDKQVEDAESENFVVEVLAPCRVADWEAAGSRAATG